ncbi:amino-acid N-acetyltransferase [Desulfobaculum xiamenense]|uniref:Amino-acid N-acetyltransferase n=1 Tax=Desulfobaculum xiamenense TaxID=995050 RepID=A0A846QIR4_9BACT|nr:N-acetyltransferase [Desulfobaculum xiamenense]NJB66937.1 amino-acid N-acetyltransferase [Desulfobaculum xiamenense]
MSSYIRKAMMQDVKAIHALLMSCASKGQLLPRSLSSLYSHLRDFHVLVDRDDERVLGCCALTIFWADHAEIRSLAVVEELKGRGFGRKLVESCLSEAVTLGVYKVFTLTYVSGFFARLGFEEVEKDVLPQKVWTDCLNCPKFPDCDETAMLLVM